VKQTSTKQLFDPAVFAVIHRAGTVWRCVIAQRPANGRGVHRPSVIATREFSDSERTRIEVWLDENNVGEVIHVLHCSEVICRTCTLPDAPDEHLIPALRLQAESHLLGIAPSHRVGMSVIEPAPGESTRIGLVLAWPEASGDRSRQSSTDEAIIAQKPGRKVFFAPDIAGLAALMNGHRPTQPLLWLDRADGSCAVAMAHANGAVFRGVREDHEDTEEWKIAIGRALAETALNAGHSSSFVEDIVTTAHDRVDSIPHGQAKLFAPAEVITDAASRLDGAPLDQDWWSTFGVAAGVSIARCGSLDDLTQLLRDEPKAAPSPIRTAIEFLSRPATARVAVVVCLIVLLFGPLVFSAIRASMLRSQYASVQQELQALRETEHKLVVYRHLNREAWSMTKVLADIVNNTPLGIELETLHIPQSRTFNLAGRAIPTDGRSAPGVVELMREQLRATGMFSDFSVTWGDADAYGNMSFELRGRLHRPYIRFQYPQEQDFGLWTFADRRDGILPPWEREEGDEPAPLEGSVRADRPAPPAPTPGETDPDYDDDNRARADASPRTRPTLPSPVDPGAGGEGGGALSPRAGRDGGGVRPTEDIPPPLSEAEINRMSHAEVTDWLTRLASARTIVRRGTDEELKARLQREWELLLERMHEAATP
jgi:hypothetical protein